MHTIITAAEAIAQGTSIRSMLSISQFHFNNRNMALARRIWEVAKEMSRISGKPMPADRLNKRFGDQEQRPQRPAHNRRQPPQAPIRARKPQHKSVRYGRAE